MNSGAPTVTVVIPTYNSASLLEEALYSVRAQTYPDYEIIVVDDGSTDDTHDVVSTLPGRVRYLRQPRRGPAAARNLGTKHAQAALIAFLDADDLWFPVKLERQVAYLSAHPEFGLVYSDLEEVDVAGRVLAASKLTAIAHDPKRAEGSVFEQELLNPFIFASTVVVRNDLLRALGGFDETLTWSETTDLFIRLTASATVGFIPEVLTKKRRHSSNLTNDFDDHALRSWIGVLKSHAQRLPRGSTIRRKANCRLAELYRRAGRYDLLRGRSIEARSELLASLALFPFGNPAALYVLLTFAPWKLNAWLKRLKDRALPRSVSEF